MERTFVQNFLTSLILTALAVCTGGFAVFAGEGLWALALAIISLTSSVGVVSLTLADWPRLREFHMLLRCFSTCLAPLCILFASLETLPGVHRVTAKEQMFMFNLCISLPLFAYLRKPKPLESLRYIELATMAVVSAVCVIAYRAPLADVDPAVNRLRYEDAARLLCASLMWASPWLVDEILRRLPHVSSLTLAIGLLLRGMSKLGACYLFALPFLPLESDFQKAFSLSS